MNPTAPSDLEVRERIRTDFGTNLVVEAGAGTGKTTLLVERARTAVIEMGVPVTEMVLITFMEKAAREIAERLKAQLGEDAHDGGERGLRAKRALDQFDRSWITTIHGLSHRLLQEFAVEAGVPLGFHVLDAHTAERQWQDCWRTWLASAEADGDGLLSDWLDLGLGLEDLTRLAREMSRWPTIPTNPVDPPAVDAFVARWHHRIAELWDAAKAAGDPKDRGVRQIADLFERFVWLFASDPTDARRLLALWSDGLAPRGNQKLWSPAAALKTQKAELGALREELLTLQRQIGDGFLGTFSQWMVSGFLPFWRRWRMDPGGLTFDDLLWETQALLRRNRPVRRILTRRWRFMMVDEFQDTDRVQAEILFRLMADSDADDWETAAIAPGRLMVVGDPKQSIYRFRGADVETYAQIRDRIARSGGDVLAIEQNFRSQAAIVDCVNREFSRRMPALPDPEQPYLSHYHPLTAWRGDRGGPRLYIGGDLSAESRTDARRWEAEAAAGLAATAVEEKWPVQGREGSRPVAFGDIAVIIPKRTGLAFYREAFMAMGVPLASVGGVGFFQQDEIRGFQAFLSAVLDPDDTIGVAAWMASPWVGLDSPGILEAGRALQTGSVAAGPAGEWQKRLSDWSRRRDEWLPADYLDALERVSGLSRYLDAEDDRQGVANLEKLHALTEEKGAQWGLRGFADWLGDKVAREDPEEEGRVGSDLDAVHLSTVHQSKGLEWPMVVISNWHGGGGRGNTMILSPDGTRSEVRLKHLKSGGWERFKAEADARDRAEETRLFYVAMTRARDYLAVLDAARRGEVPLFATREGFSDLPPLRSRPMAPASAKAPPKAPEWPSVRIDIPGRSEPREEEAEALEFSQLMDRHFQGGDSHALFASPTAREWFGRALAHPYFQTVANASAYPGVELGDVVDQVRRTARVDLLVDRGETVDVVFYWHTPSAGEKNPSLPGVLRRRLENARTLLAVLLDKPADQIHILLYRPRLGQIHSFS